MSGLTNFNYEETDGKRIWKYGRPGHPEVRAESPGKHGPDDWKAIMVAPPTLELVPTMPAIVLSASVMVASQVQVMSEHQAYDLGLPGWLEQAASVKTITDAILTGHACHINWELLKRRYGPAR